MNIELEEIISFVARRGEADIVQLLRHIQEQYERSFDPDYETESDTESEVSMNDIVEEDIEINPSMNGFVSLA